MVDYSRWDKIDTGTDESSGEAVPAPAHQIISPSLPALAAKNSVLTSGVKQLKC